MSLNKVHGCKVNPFPGRGADFPAEHHISRPECRIPCSSSGSCAWAVTGRVDWTLFNPALLKLHTSVRSQGTRETDLSRHLASEFSGLNVFATDAVERSSYHGAHACMVTASAPTNSYYPFVYDRKLCIPERYFDKKYLYFDLRTKPLNRLE